MYTLIGVLFLFGLILSLIKICMPILVICVITAVLIVVFQSVFKEDDSDGEELKEKTKDP